MDTGMITSLCMVNDIGINKAGLIRIADLVNGRLVPFEAEPGNKIFENRDRIYRKSGPDRDGFVGIWEWNAVDNTNNIGNDYVDKSIYMSDLDPIQVVKVPNTDGPDDIISSVAKGVELNHIDHDIIFVENTLSIGVFCRKDTLEKIGKTVRVKQDQVSFPVVYISQRRDIIPISVYPGGYYYAFLSPKETGEYVYAMDPVETMKSLILQEFTRKKFQAVTGGTIKDFKQFKEIVESIGDNTSILTRIQESYHCSLENAQKYVKEFQERADELINEDDVTDSMLQGIVANSGVLAEKARADIEQRWEQDHREIVKKKEAELLNITQQLEAASDQLSKIEEKEHSTQSHIDAMEKELKDREALGDSVLKYVHEKLELAKEDVARFLAERIVYSETNLDGNTCQIVSRSSSSSDTYGQEISENLKRESCLQLPSSDGIDLLEEAVDIIDLFSLIEENLSIAGVSNDRIYLAAYLTAAYQERMSVLLVGPGGEAIVNAFSAAITGKSPLVLDCSGSINTTDIQRVREGSEDIILVRNVFDSEWKNAVINMIDSTRKMFFCVYPFSEDLFMEPRSLYSYVVPMFTETYYGKPSNERFIGSDSTVLLAKEEFVEWKHPYRKLLKKMKLNQYAINRIGRLLSWFLKYADNAEEDIFYRYCLFSYAVVTDSRDAFLEDVEGNMIISRRWKDYFTEYFEGD